MSSSKVVSQAEFRVARQALLEKEKEVTRANDVATAARRALPMVEISKQYTFTTSTASGGAGVLSDDDDKDNDATKSVTLADLFENRRQLIIFHFMFDPKWDAGCPSCSLTADGLGVLEHFHARNTTIACVSRAPLPKILAYKKRMGWAFPWYSSYGSEFNYDFGATDDGGEISGADCFVRGDGGKGVMGGEEGKIYHTYSCFNRGQERLNSQAGWMDMTVLGRQNVDGQVSHKRRDEYTEEELMGQLQCQNQILT